MDGMLSQSEINALLNGMELNSEEEKPDEGASAGSVSDGAAGDVSLTDVEKDAIGEVANISMGTSATTLFSLVNKKVNITTLTSGTKSLSNYYLKEPLQHSIFLIPRHN